MRREYWFWINNIEGIGISKTRNLLNVFKSPYRIFHATQKELEKVKGLTNKDIACILNEGNKEKQIKRYSRYILNHKKMVFPIDENYPTKLQEIFDKPNILYYKGILPLEDQLSVAIVGSRQCTPYGCSMARELSRQLSHYNVNIISGLALGIDSEAHRGAVMAGGRTFGILAGGVDRCYPACNFNLYMEIQKNGGIISEYPSEVRTVPGMFPLRNRIISGLSDVVIVVEAGKKSGSLITASYALEHNRRVLAIPGRLGDPASQGCNELIAQGAEVIYSLDALIDELGLATKQSESNMNNNVELASDEKMLYSLLLDFTSKSLESLMMLTNMNCGRIMTALIQLETKGLIRETSKNFYVRVR